MAITKFGVAEIKKRLGIEFVRDEDVLGSLYLAKNSDKDRLKFQFRFHETSPAPAMEIMLPIATAANDLDELLKRLNISRDELFWIHPQAGGTLRRFVVDKLLSNLDEREPQIQILIGPRQVGKTTAVMHLMNEWHADTHYASADSVLSDYEPWLQKQWQKALLKGEETLLVLDEIQKVTNWTEHVKFLWDKTKKRKIRVVLLGSTSLSHFLTQRGTESLAGRFSAIYVPHWSFLETKEAFDSSVEEFSLFGGYPKAMEYSADPTKWFNYVAMSIINPIINVDIYQQRRFKNIEYLRRAFKVFCKEANTEINYKRYLREIQETGNIDIIKRYLDGYYDSFLLSPVPLIDDNGNVDPRRNPKIMITCPAVYSFGRSSFDDFSKDTIRFQQAVTSELKKIPFSSFGYWKKSEDTGMDLFIKTLDNCTFGITIEGSKTKWSATKSNEAFRKTFKKGRLVSVNPDNFGDFLKGQRAFLEATGI